MTAGVTDPAVRALLDAINAGDSDAFFAALAPDATMSDDGRDRDLRQWVDREIFSSQGQVSVESATDGGRSLLAAYTNATYGTMRVFWRFTVRDGKISRFETGQARPASS
jgi:SnoaL-like domain